MTGGKQGLKILIKSVNWIGDAVMLTPAFRALRRKYPDSRISMLVKAGVRQIFSENTDIDELIVENSGEYKGLAGLLRLITQLRSKKYDAGVVIQGRSFKAAVLIFLSGAKRKIGYGHNLRNIFLTDIVRAGKDIKHDSDVFLGALAPLGVTAGEKRPCLNTTEEARRWAGEFLRKNGISAGAKLAAINPGAQSRERRWPEEKYALLADRIIDDFGYRVIVFGGPDDGDTVKKVLYFSKHNLIEASPDLLQLASLAGACRIFISNDTGPAHVAAAAGAPVVVLYGVTDPRRTAPLGDRNVIIKARPALRPERGLKPNACMDRISVEEVIAEVKKLL